jgi:large subunit ribosomal protein L1
MAKKTPESSEAAPAEAKEKKGKEPKEAKAKEGKEPKEAKAKGKAAAEAAPAGEQPAVAAPAAAEAPKPASDKPADASKKKGKAPGKAPPRGKKLRNHLRNMVQRISKEGPLPLPKAVNVLKQLKRSKFDETVEIHMALGIDATQSEQMIRGSVSLPHGIGKSVRLVVFCQGDNVAKAKEAGADHAGSDELIEKIQKENWLDFDVALATQDLMGKVSRLGKVLGPRGLMPTPKSGTVVPVGSDIAAAVREFKAGKVEYRTDKGGNVHAGVGKLSFAEANLVGNIQAFVEQIKSVRPTGIKGNFVKSVTLSATMSPGIPVSI